MASVNPVAQRTALGELGDEVLASLELIRVVNGQDVRVIEG